MKRRSLADVLIKILGVWELVRWLPHTILGFVQMLEAGGRFSGPGFASFWAGTIIEFLIAIVLIAKSRGIAELLFRTEDEESPEI